MYLLHSHGIFGLNPLGIGEGFERIDSSLPTRANGLNPLGIGEGFELKCIETSAGTIFSLNPLGIGEGFEPTVMVIR